MKHHGETHIIKNTVETKQRAQRRSEARIQERHNQDHDEPDHRYRQPGTDHLKQTKEEAVIQSEDRPKVVQLKKEAKLSTIIGLTAMQGCNKHNVHLAV